MNTKNTKNTKGFSAGSRTLRANLRREKTMVKGCESLGKVHAKLAPTLTPREAHLISFLDSSAKEPFPESRSSTTSYSTPKASALMRTFNVQVKTLRWLRSKDNVSLSETYLIYTFLFSLIRSNLRYLNNYNSISNYY